MKFFLKHEEVTRLQLSGELSPSDANLYEYLAHRSDVSGGTGKINRTLVMHAARDLRRSERTVNRSARKLRALGLLAGGGEEGDNCLAGFLPHIAILARAKPSRKQSVAEVAKPQTETETRAVSAAKSKSERLPIPSRNGGINKGGTVESRKVVDEILGPWREKTKSWSG